jgi:hypothetical protein
VTAAVPCVALELPDDAFELVPEQGRANMLALLEDLNRDVACLNVVEIVDAASEGRVAQATQHSRSVAKGLEEIKTKLLAPLLSETKAIRAVFAPYEAILVQAKTIGDRKLSDYRAKKQKAEELEKIAAARAREEAARKEQEATERAAAATTKRAREAAELQAQEAAEAGRRATQVLEKPETRGIKTEHGATYFVKVWKYRIDRPELVPDEYWVLDEAKVAKAVRAEVAIPGVIAWQEEAPRDRT